MELVAGPYLHELIKLQNAVLTDEIGSTKMIIWGKLILKSEEDVPIILQNVKVDHCYAVSITTL